MSDTTFSDDDVTSIDNPTSGQEVGLLGGLMDGIFVAVEYRGFIIHRSGDTYVVTEDGREVGGRYRDTGAALTGLIEWLHAKAEQRRGAA